jgi:polysaccharide biosynthesis transport protein
MPSELASPAPRYVTLRDYLRVLRRYWILIGVIALVGALAGLVNALRQTPAYEATAQVSFQDPTQNLSIVGLGSTPVQTPAELAAVGADTATTPGVLSSAQRLLHSSYSAHQLQSAISTTVDSGSGLLLITADATSPSAAAQLSNAVASALVDQDNAQTRAHFAQLAGTVSRRIAALTRHGAGPAAATGGQLGFYTDELARLNTLAAFASTAALANAAQPPTGASGTSRTRNVGLGLALGLLLGIAAAFVRDATDRRLRSLADIQDSFPQPVLGRVGAQSLGRVVDGPGGAGKTDGSDREAFRILRRNVELLDHQNVPRLILVTSAVPEEGKTTVAGSLALAMAAAGKRTLLVDCDLRRPALASRLGARATPGLSEYLSGSAGWQEILSTLDAGTRPVGRAGDRDRASSSGRRFVASNGSEIVWGNGVEAASSKAAVAVAARELVFVPAGSPSSRSAELLGSSQFTAFLDAVSHAYEVVVLDSTPLLPVSDTLEMLPHADAVIICARASRTTREQASAVQAALSHFPQVPTGLVVTGIKRGDRDYADYSYDYDYA